MSKGRPVAPRPDLPTGEAAVACPHCGTRPTVPRQDGLVPICQGCMLGSSTPEPGSSTAATASHSARAASVLAARMEVAIPLWVLLLQELDDARFWYTWRRWVREADALPISEALLYPDANRVEAEQHFTAYAKSIAALSFCNGGVPMFGRRWESKRPPARNGQRAVPAQPPAAAAPRRHRQRRRPR